MVVRNHLKAEKELMISKNYCFNNYCFDYFYGLNNDRLPSSKYFIMNVFPPSSPRNATRLHFQGQDEQK